MSPGFLVTSFKQNHIMPYSLRRCHKIFRYPTSLNPHFRFRNNARESLMRICFSLFNINELEETNHNINRFVLQECGDFTWRVSDWEELVEVTLGRWWGKDALRAFRRKGSISGPEFSWCRLITAKATNAVYSLNASKHQKLQQLILISHN